ATAFRPQHRLLRAAGRAGLDDRRRPLAAVDRDHPHRPAASAGHLPHRGREEPAGRPRAEPHFVTLALRRGLLPGAHAPGPVFHLWWLAPAQPAGRFVMADAAVRMDRQYRWQRHIYDVTRVPYLLGRDRLIPEVAPPCGAHVLEIGCGTGRNLIRIARTYPGVECFGLDVSNVMLDTARRSIEGAGLAGR